MTKLIRLMYLSFVFSLVTFAVLSFSYIQRLKSLDHNIKSLERTNLVLLLLEEVNGQLYFNGIMLRDMMLTRDKSTWPDIVISNVDLLKKVDSLALLTSGDPGQETRILQMKGILQQRSALINDSVSYTFDANTNEINAGLLQKLQSVLEDYKKVFVHFRQSEYQKRAERQEARDQFEKFTLPLLSIVLSFAGLVIIASFFYMMMTLRRRIFLQHELQKKIESLNLANKELENLSRVTSHHIQEPMRKISNFSSLLDRRLDKISSVEAREITKKIEDNASALQVLAQNLVQYSHLIQDQRCKESVNLQMLVADVVNSMDDVVYEKAAEINCQSLPTLSGIPGQLTILFRELIKNAIEFSQAGEHPRIEIYESAPRRSGTILVTVKDYGIGLSPDYADRIFRIFEQLEPRSAPGKGIGLAMCSRIMLNHGGRIWADGEEGKFASINLEFPAA